MANVTYNILWVCSANGMNEATEGHVKIHMKPEWMDIGGSSPDIGGTCDSEATRQDFMIFTRDGSPKTLAVTSTTFEESTQDIPCIAELWWGSWEAAFYGFYNPHSNSFRSSKAGLDDFNMRSMNEWMEMGLMGQSVTRLGISCPQRDDYGHEILVLHITSEPSRLVSTTAKLFAKRVTREGSLDFSEREFQELGISRNTTSSQILNQPDSPAAPSEPNHGASHGENSARGDERVSRTVSSDGAVHRSVSRGRQRERSWPGPGW